MPVLVGSYMNDNLSGVWHSKIHDIGHLHLFDKAPFQKVYPGTMLLKQGSLIKLNEKKSNKISDSGPKPKCSAYWDLTTGPSCCGSPASTSWQPSSVRTRPIGIIMSGSAAYFWDYSSDVFFRQKSTKCILSLSRLINKTKIKASLGQSGSW